MYNIVIKTKKECEFLARSKEPCVSFAKKYEILKYDLKTAIQNLNYDGSPNIDTIVLLCQKHLGKKYIPDDLAIKLRKKYGTLKRLFKKPNNKPFTPFEDEYIMTHYIKDSTIKFDRSSSIIKKRRKYLRMLSNNCK